MEAVKPVYLLLICQGFYLGSVGQRWTFPDEVTALIGSCVEIPCTYSTTRNLRSSSTVWYLYDRKYYLEILNTEDSSLVLEEYRDRTSLVPGEKSCTLRIDPVTREDGREYYYPGITGDASINAYEKQSKSSVYLRFTDTMNVQLHGSKTMTEGEATTIRCSADHTCRSNPPTIQWNKPGGVTQKSVENNGGRWREESILTYIPTYEHDGSDLQCTATYPNGQKNTKSFTLNINYAPKNVTITVIGKDEVMEGSDVTLQCNSVSNPDVSEYEWYKGENKTKLQYTGREITVRNVTRNMEAYSCAAINTKGRGVSAPMEIPVPYAATGVHITVKTEGEITELSCDFLGSRPDVSHYTWMKDGSILHNKTGKTLTLHNDDTYGQYSCIAHNRAGDSSSEAIDVKPGSVDLPLVLGTVAGVFFLIFFVLLVFFFIRQNNNKPVLPTPPIRGTIPARIPHQKTITKEENQYGNIQRDGHIRPSPKRLGPSVDVNIEENFAIYSNSEVIQPSNDAHYSIIFHEPHDKEQIMSSIRSHVEVVEYATLKR